MPLIVISGYKNFDYIKQAISANAVEYLLKPFSAQTNSELYPASHYTARGTLIPHSAIKVNRGRRRKSSI